MHIVGGHVAAAHAATAALIVSAASLAVSPAEAAGTLAGTSIVNVATATYTDAASALQTATSNSVAIRVEEVLDVAVSTVGAQPMAVTPGASEYRLTFRVSNSGNGPEAFALLAETALGGDDFDPSLLRVVVDRDGDGLYDPLVDTVFAAGSEPLLAPDASVDVFVFVGLPAAIASGDQGFARLGARALSGTGPPGTLYAGAGIGGSDAVVGNSTASADAASALLVASAQPTLTKAISFGGPGLPAAGSVITYTIAADLGGSGATSAVVADPLPAGTSYVPGSLTLAGSPLTDAADGDAGAFTGSAIEVALPTAAGPQVISFQVEIN